MKKVYVVEYIETNKIYVTVAADDIDEAREVADSYVFESEDDNVLYENVIFQESNFNAISSSDIDHLNVTGRRNYLEINREELRLDFVNNFLTVDKFAEHYSLTKAEALDIVS